MGGQQLGVPKAQADLGGSEAKAGQVGLSSPRQKEGWGGWRQDIQYLPGLWDLQMVSPSYMSFISSISCADWISSLEFSINMRVDSASRTRGVKEKEVGGHKFRQKLGLWVCL